MKLALRVTTLSTLTFVATLAAGLPLGCDGESGTSGARTTLETRIVAADGSRDFTNAVGWRIRLSKALVATGPLYFYDGEPLFARRAPSGHGLFGIRTAHAHPGHYVRGDAMGEMRTVSSADLLAGATLGIGQGVTGVARSATFSYETPAKGPYAAELGAAAILLEGTAERGGEARAFRAEIALDETKDAAGRPEIQGCAFSPVEMTGDGVVTVEVKLPLWFDQVDFEEAPAGGEPTPLAAGLARNQLVRATKVALGYAFTYSPK